MRRSPSVSALLCLAVAAGGCGGAAGGPASEPARSQVALARDDPGAPAIAAIGERLYAAIASDSLASVLFDDQALRILLQPEAAGRAAALRLNASAHLRVPEIQRGLVSRGEYLGACVQELRSEPAGGPAGLASRGWVFSRILVAGREAGGGRVASWVEGQFVYADVGFGATVLERVEAPRRDHSDLEIATCDLRVGID